MLQVSISPALLALSCRKTKVEYKFHGECPQLCTKRGWGGASLQSLSQSNLILYVDDLLVTANWWQRVPPTLDLILLSFFFHLFNIPSSSRQRLSNGISLFCTATVSPTHPIRDITPHLPGPISRAFVCS